MTTAAKTYLIRAATIVALAVCALFMAWAFATPQAYANRQLSAPVNVSDDITRLNVDKLDKDTHEQVTGASMAIIEKDTGTIVDEWVTDGSTHATDKKLDVNVVYILREMAAPEGYDVAQDTEFIVNETEGEGITILSGDSAELYESYKLNLYDEAQPNNLETTVYKTKEKEVSEPTEKETTTSKTVAPKTGDDTPIVPVAAGVIACGVGIGVLQFLKRRTRKNNS